MQSKAVVGLWVLAVRAGKPPLLAVGLLMLMLFKMMPKVWIWIGENTGGTDKDVRASGRRTLAQTSEKLFPQVGVGATSEEVTNGWGVSGKRGLIIHLSTGWQRGLLWRTHRWPSDRTRHTPANTHLHRGPRTYAPTEGKKKKEGEEEEKNRGLFWRRAHHLGAHHMPRWLTTCSPGPRWENVHKNTYGLRAERNLSRFITAPAPPPAIPPRKRSFLACWCAIVWRGKIST